jgi:hypothetical protein
VHTLVRPVVLAGALGLAACGSSFTSDDEPSRGGSSGNGGGGASGSGGSSHGGGAGACRSTARLAATADTYLDSLEPRTNFGDSQILKLGGSYGEPNRYRVLVTFDVQNALPPGATLLTAQLRFRGGAFMNEGVIGATVHRLQRAFDEYFATWDEVALNDPWATAGGDFDPAPVATGNAAPSAMWDVSSDLRRQLAEGVPYYGWLAQGASTNSSDIDSRERTSGTPPELLLEFCVP